MKTNTRTVILILVMLVLSLLSTGNVSPGVTSTARTLSDADYLVQVTNLRNTTNTQNVIIWRWDNPKDNNFSKLMIYLNGQFKINSSKYVTIYAATRLTPNTSYTISTRAVDNKGTASLIWKNHTSRTLGSTIPGLTPTPTASPTPTPTITATPPPIPTNKIIVTTDKYLYRKGEQITFTVSNQGTETFYLDFPYILVKNLMTGKTYPESWEPDGTDEIKPGTSKIYKFDTNILPTRSAYQGYTYNGNYKSNIIFII